MSARSIAFGDYARFSDRVAGVCACLLGAIFFGVSTYLAVAQHATFHTRARDMGIYVQALWNAAQGRPLLTTLLQSNTNHLAEHVAPVLLPLAPLAGLWPDGSPLIVIQQLFLSGCGIPLYLAARRALGRGLALAILAAFYLMPAISRVSLSEFHPVVMAALPVTAGVAAVLDRRWRSGALWLAAALLYEEEVGPTVVGAAALVLAHAPRSSLPRSQATLGLVLGSSAALWVLLVAFVVMPGYRAPEAVRESGNRALAHYEDFLRQPGIAGSWLLQERGLDAAASLLLPDGGLALLAPAPLLVGLPGFVLLFLQDRPASYAGHWAAPLLPVVWLAAAAGLARLVRWQAAFDARRFVRLTSLALGLLSLGAVVAYIFDSHFPGGREWEADKYAFSETDAQLGEATRLVPPGSSIVATRRAVPHLAARREAYTFPSSFYSAPFRFEPMRQDVYLLDLSDSFTRRALEPSESDSVLEKRPRYHVRRFGLNVLLLTRERPQPTNARPEVFGGAIQLLGFDPPASDSGGAWSIWLYWEALRRPEAEPIRLVRLLGAGGETLAEVSGRPLDDYLPVRQWDRSQIVAERLTLTPPQSALPGDLRLVVSWQDPDSRSLALDDGRTALELARMEP